MEDSELEPNNIPIEPTKNKFQEYAASLYQNKPLLGLMLFTFICIVSFLLIFFQRKQPTEDSNANQISPTIATAKETPSVTPTIINSPTEATQYKVIPTLVITSATLPTATNTPAPAATNTPVPRTPNPPKLKITFPSEGQSIELNNSQTFCAVEVPDGGDYSNSVKRVNINNSGWTDYSNPNTTCYSPAEGQNNLKMQFKNGYGEESSEVGVNFTFHRTE